MSIKRVSGIAIAIAFAAGISGCMSMDEMLASDNEFLRGIGETRAVAFATDGQNTMEDRLAVVPKIKNQEKLADIYLSKSAAPEVKKVARDGMTEVGAFVYVLQNTDDAQAVDDALDFVSKDDDSRLLAAWSVALQKPQSTIPAKLLDGVKDGAKISEAVSTRMDELSLLADDTEKLRQKFGDKVAESNDKKIVAMIGLIQKFAPYVTDEKLLESLLKRPDIVETRDTPVDLYTPFNNRLEILQLRKDILALPDADKDTLLRTGMFKMTNDDKILLDAKTDSFICGKVAVTRGELESSVKDKTILERIAAEKAAAEARRQRRATLVKIVEKYRKLPEDKRDECLAKIKSDEDRLVFAWELAARSSGDALLKAAAGKIAAEFDGTKVAKFLRDEINGYLKTDGADSKSVVAATNLLAPFAKDELIVTPLYEQLAQANQTDLARPLKTVSDSLRLAALGDKDIRRLLAGETITKEDKYVFKMDSDSPNTIAPSRAALIAALSDDAFRNRLLKEDKLYKDAVAFLGYGKAEELAKKIRLSLEDNGFVERPENGRMMASGPYRSLHEWQCELSMACYNIESKDTSIWLKAVKSFDGDKEAQIFYILNFIHESWRDDDEDPKKAAANTEILASVPQETLLQMFYEMAYQRKGLDGNDIYRSFTSQGGMGVVAKAIKDKEIIKHLLIDYDGWARYTEAENSRTRAYRALVNNISDEDVIWQLYANTEPTTRSDIISLGYLSSLAKKLSEPKRKALTDAAFARAEEVAKTNIVVKGYYLGMSLADFRLIDAANGNQASGTYDDATSRKMVKIVFDSNSYNTFLGLDTGNPISDIDKFGRDYGTVPDGVDVSDKVTSDMALRIENNLEGYSSQGVCKWVDTYHNFQAEIDDNRGILTFRYPVKEEFINQTDIRQEQANAIFDVFAGTDDDYPDYYE